MDYYFLFYISRKYLQFRKKLKAFVKEIFDSPHTSNRINLPRNCFSNYLYLKDMYITLKEIEKILFVLVLEFCSSVNFETSWPSSLNKNLNFSKFSYNFPCEKVNFSLIDPFILPFIAFEEHY